MTKEQNEMRKFVEKDAKGITLIALVVTIIVLIILAGITISMTVGDNGIFTKAKEARRQYEIATIREKIETTILDIQSDKIAKAEECTIDVIIEELPNKINNITIEKDGNVAKGTYKGYNFTINQNLKVYIEGENLEATVQTEIKEYVGKDKNGKYAVKILMEIKTEEKISEVEIENTDGTTLKETVGNNTYSKELEIELDKEYKINLVTENNAKTSKKILIPSKLEIQNVEQFLEFRDNVNLGLTYEGITINLKANIDLGGDKNDTDTWWIPIGSNEKNITFNGTFDGNDHTIYNMYDEENSNFEFIALFSRINSATIKNLSVKGELIAGENKSDANPTAAGIVGTATGNCKIENCINEVNVTKKSNGRETAGILGYIDAGSNTVISKCINKGTISGANACAGLVGTVVGSLTINDCYNEGSIGLLYSNIVGGIIGRTETGATTVTINSSYNNGAITSVRYAAGILANVKEGEVTVNNCYNEGTITVANRDKAGCVGGIIGRAMYTCSKITVANSYNKIDINTQIETKKTILGGILGQNETSNANIINCYNLGNLEGDYTAGICGLNTGSESTNLNPKLSIKNSYNTGNIIGRVYASGIARLHIYTGKIEIQNVYYLDTTATEGVQNSENDEAIPLTQKYMNSENFVKDLNENLSKIEATINLNSWKYEKNSYPTF